MQSEMSRGGTTTQLAGDSRCTTCTQGASGDLLLNSSYPLGPAAEIGDGGFHGANFSSFHSYVLLHDSDDSERQVSTTRPPPLADHGPRLPIFCPSGWHSVGCAAQSPRPACSRLLSLAAPSHRCRCDPGPRGPQDVPHTGAAGYGESRVHAPHRHNTQGRPEGRRSVRRGRLVRRPHTLAALRSFCFPCA